MLEKKGKITVKHYLNTRAKAKTFNGEKHYPLYLQLIVAGQKAQLKSKITEYSNIYKGYFEKDFPDPERIKLIMQGYFTEYILKKISSEKLFPLSNLLNDEISLITQIIKSKLSFGSRRLSLKNFSNVYELHLKDIHIILDEYIKAFYLRELNEIFLKSSKRDDTRKLFKVSNYFIHYIDWSNPFCDYYETTYEVLPTEIKFLENHLSEDLKKDIKALLAFYSRNNYLRRYLDKIDKGRIPTTNYIDWLEKGRDFVSKEFIKIFGKQKASEYISTLDIILSKVVKLPINL
jgi:hypothetical protein